MLGKDGRRGAGGAHGGTGEPPAQPGPAAVQSGRVDRRRGGAAERRHARGCFSVRIRHGPGRLQRALDRKSTRLNSSHGYISYAVFCLKKKKTQTHTTTTT